MDSKILIIDDDEKLQKLLHKYFSTYGLETYSHFNGLNVLEKINTIKPDAIILDIMMPFKEGTEVLKEIRGNKLTIPIIMLTARGDDMDKILGLELGADDYLPKPFNPRELVARIKAILRRVTANQLIPIQDSKLLIIDNISLNTSTQQVQKYELKQELSSTEFKILKALMKRTNQILSRDELMDIARGKEFMALDRSIDMHISKLRNKLDLIGDSKKRIKTSWGSGYLFIKNLEDYKWIFLKN